MKVLFSLCLYFFLVYASYAQQFNGLFYCGVNQSRGLISHWNFIKTGGTLGIGSSLTWKKKFSIELQLQFDQKGFRILDPYLRYDLRLNYIQMPLIGNYYLKKNIHFSLGGSYARLLSYREVYPAYLIHPIDFVDYDYGYIAGIGYIFNPHIQTSLFFSLSVNDASKTPVKTVKSFGNFNNQLFSLRLVCFIYNNTAFHKHHTEHSEN